MTPSTSAVPLCAVPAERALACPWCGQLHTRIPLRPGDVSQCVRCVAALAHGRASDWLVTLAWVLTGLILWVPANLLPIVAVQQFGNARESLLFTGVTSLWEQGMPWVSVLVALTGIVAPLLLLLALGAVLVPIALGHPAPGLRFLALWLRRLELWAMPEVYLLGILVAFIKLGTVVRADPAAGLWCHGAMAVALLVAWRRFDFDAGIAALGGEKPESIT